MGPSVSGTYMRPRNGTPPKSATSFDRTLKASNRNACFLIDIWIASAQKRRARTYIITHANSAVSTFRKGSQSDWVITKIGTSGAEQTYISGHSSGCTIANEVDGSSKTTVWKAARQPPIASERPGWVSIRFYLGH